MVTLGCDDAPMMLTELSRAWHGPAESSPEPNAIEAGTGALVLAHGISGSPQSMRPWGEHHAARGWDVRIPLLPGHGTRWQDLGTVTWRDWTRALAREVRSAAAEHERVCVGGLSMGGALTLAMAEDPELSARIDAIVLVNPAVRLPRVQALALPVLSRIRPSVAGIASDIAAEGAHEEAYERLSVRAVEQMRRLQRRVRSQLAEVRCPVLLATSVADHVVDPRCSDLVAARVSGEVERLALTDSFHVATLDHDAPLLFERSAEFLHRRTARTDTATSR